MCGGDFTGDFRAISLPISTIGVSESMDENTDIGVDVNRGGNIEPVARLFEVPSQFLRQWQAAFAGFVSRFDGQFANRFDSRFSSHFGGYVGSLADPELDTESAIARDGVADRTQSHPTPPQNSLLPAAGLDFTLPPPTVFELFSQVEQAYYYQIPLVNQFRGITLREGLIFAAQYQGRTHLAEFAPFAEYAGLEAARWLAAALADLQLADLPQYRQNIPVNVTIPVVSPEQAYELVLNSGGCGTAKVKVADRRADITADYERIVAVRQALKDTGVNEPKIRIDVNGLWDVDTAAEYINYLDRAAEGLEYVEQPCQTLDELQELKAKISAPIAVDELIRRSAQPLVDFPIGLAEVAVLKLPPLGGTRQLLQMAGRAESLGMRVVFSSALDSAVGISRALRAAAAVTKLPHACGLATSQLMRGSIIANPPAVAHGALPLFLPQLDYSLLSKVDADITSRIAGWHARIMEINKTLISVFNGEQKC